MSAAREEILARVRAAIAPARGSAPEVPRDYRTASADGIETFAERLHDYGAHTERVHAGALDRAVRARLQARGVRRLVVPEGVPEEWTVDVEALGDVPPLPFDALDLAGGALTTCAVAIAQTGTIVLDGSAGMGRRALSLVPDYLLCVVRAEQIASSVPEAIARLDPVAPLTFISGPSATVDIEMVRVAGVHGPRRLDVIIADRSGEA
ncbi:MAG TPA: LUD domain-containing protein [Solirubrobacteraceae bacterium]|nr:LUD domain-containing protein [Solirubrobacteraceae bacterium]